MLKKTAIFLFSLVGSVIAQAATLSYTAVVTPSATPALNFTEATPPAWWTGEPRVFLATNWSQDLALQKFNPSLGTLNSVTVTYRGAEKTFFEVENKDAEPFVVRKTWGGTMKFTLPGATEQTLNLSNTADYPLSAYDGVIDYAGTSGITAPPFTIETNSGNPITQTQSSGLNTYKGTDTFTVPISAAGRATWTTSGNMSATARTYAWAAVTVSYDYTPAPIDLTIIKSVTSSGPYRVGSNITYSLAAKNQGPGTAQAAISVKDNLPAGLTYVSATGTGWDCSAASQEITCTRTATSPLVANASADVITVMATIANGATGSLVNYAQVIPAANETLLESNPLGTANNGYESGDPAIGSNNDDSKAITVAGVVTPVPTLSQWGLILLSFLMLVAVAGQVNRKRA